MTYIGDFISTLRQRSNIGVVIYLVLNIFVLSFFFMAAGLEGITGIAVVIGVYAFSLCIALSSIGEWFLRWQNGCRKIKRKEYLNKIEPLFLEVYGKARQLNPAIPSDVKIFLNSDPVPNAFATGRKTICITKGLLQLSDEEIKAILAHEFGHLSNKDTDLLLLVYVGNVVVSAIFAVLNILFLIADYFTAQSFGGIVGAILFFYKLFIRILLNIGMWSWTQIGRLLVLSSSRANEYKADEFAFNIGYGYHLASALDKLSDSTPEQGLWKALQSTHPRTDDRVAKLQDLGVEYALF